jgi:hypothetical protein
VFGKVVEASVVDENDWIRVANILMRYYYHVQDPESLSDEEWANYYNELIWIRKKEAQTS